MRDNLSEGADIWIWGFGTIFMILMTVKEYLYDSSVIQDYLFLWRSAQKKDEQYIIE